MGTPKVISELKSGYMIIAGIGLALTYWISEAIFYAIVSDNARFFTHLLSPDSNQLALRILVLCFFLIFGSHAQYTFNEKKKADQALESSRRKHFDLISNMQEGYFETDSSGRITFANEAFFRIAGIDRKSLIDTDLVRLPFVAASVEPETAIGDLAQKRELEWVFGLEDGTERFVEATLYPIAGETGGAAGYQGLARDVTRRVRAKRLEQEKRAAEESSRAKGEFLANMSHEIRTPLNSIIGLIELALDSGLNPTQRDDLSVAKSAAYSLLSVINDILDFSKIEAGKLELDQAEFKLHSFLSDTLRIMAVKASEKNLELACRVDPDIPNRLIGDPVRFRQIMINLVGNAIKFTEHGEIIVSVQCQHRQEDKIDLYCSVKDTGIGILPDKQKKIFGAFDQADGSTARQYGGTGLGLTVSAQLVQLMKGSIWVDSEPEQGSNFQFNIPFKTCPDHHLASGEPRHIDIDGLRVLIVEDNATSALVISEILEKWKMIPIVATSQSEAKRRIDAEEKKGGVDIVLLDEDIYDNSFLEWFLNHHPIEAPSIKIILMTMPRQNRWQPNRDRLVDAIVMKPVSPSDLLEAILTAMGLTHLVCQDKDGGDDMAEILPPLRVLVAEDTGFNQKYIGRLLEKWGLSARIVTDGNQAVKEAARDRYDIILMDIQMPELDGLEATRKIRQNEKSTGTYTPIVAMTAHAMKGDKERCLEAGMDGYVAKPVSQNSLFCTIRDLVAGDTIGPVPEDQSTAEAKLGQGAEHFTFIEAFGNDISFLKEIAEIFLKEAPPMIRTIQQAIESKDHALLAQTAHSLKGMLKGFQAQQAVEMAKALEDKGKAGNLAEAKPLCQKLIKETKRLQIHLSSLIKGIKDTAPPAS